MQSTAPAEANRPQSSDAKVFRFSQGLACFLFVAAVLSAGLGIVFLAMKDGADKRTGVSIVRLACAAFCIFSSALAFRSFRRFRDSVAVDSTGIWYVPRKGAPTYIAWPDVASVEAHETAQRLVLRDQSGSRRMRLEYQLENFSELRQFVLSHAPNSAAYPSQLPSVFHRTPINKAICGFGAAMFAFLGIAALRAGYLGYSLISMAFVVYAACVLVLDPSTLRIEQDAVIIQYPGWKRRIPLATIADVSISDVMDRGNTWAMVKITRRTGRPIKLFRIREGSLVLWKALSMVCHSVK